MCSSECSRFMNPIPDDGKAYIPTASEHRANIYTHGIFIPMSVLGFLSLVYLSHTASHTWIAWIYGSCLILLFTLSTMFHVVCYLGHTGQLRSVCHKGDRAIIYVFIAAAYTPWMVLKQHTMGEEVLWFTWLATVLLVMYQFTFHNRYQSLEIAFYLALGICPSVFILEMQNKEGVFEIAMSGGIVVLGIYFFKKDGVIPYAHAIWHCFVTAGAGYHYYAVLKYLYPSSFLYSSTDAVAEKIG